MPRAETSSGTVSCFLLPASCLLPPVSLHPVGDEDVGLAAYLAMAIRGEDELLAVRGEHREAVELFAVGDALQIRAIHIDHVEIKVAPLGIGHIRGEDDAFAVGQEERREV